MTALSDGTRVKNNRFNPRAKKTFATHHTLVSAKSPSRRKAAPAHEWWCKWGTFPKGFLRHARCSRAALSPHALCCDHATTFSHQFPFLSALLLDLYLGSQSTCWSHVGPKCLSRPHCIISTSLVVGVMLYFSGACLPQWWWWCGGRTWSLKMDLVSKWKPRWHFGGSDGS